MIDAIQLPILLKAIEFVFDEGHKILEERRERRKAQENPPQAEPQPAEETAVVQVQNPPPTKQDLLAAKIDEILWKDHETDVQHLVRLLEIYSRNYQLAKEQYAKWGSALVPPIIANNLSEAENAMLATIKQLEGVLSKIYEKDIDPAI